MINNSKHPLLEFVGAWKGDDIDELNALAEGDNGNDGKNEYFEMIGLKSKVTKYPIMKWINAKTKLPEVHEGTHGYSREVLIYVPDDLYFTSRLRIYKNGKKTWTTFNSITYSYDKVTHWMPLPEPPKDE